MESYVRSPRKASHDLDRRRSGWRHRTKSIDASIGEGKEKGEPPGEMGREIAGTSSAEFLLHSKKRLVVDAVK
jgi:hypothetical protein